MEEPVSVALPLRLRNAGTLQCVTGLLPRQTRKTYNWTHSAHSLFEGCVLSDYNCILQGGRVAEIQEQLEESQMTLNTMNAMRHVLPFKERVVNMLSTLSDVSGKPLFHKMI